MSAPERLKTAQEIRESAGAVSSTVLPDEVAESLPMPMKSDGKVQIIILYYREKMAGQQLLISPPHHAMILDAATGKVIRFWACTPEDLGLKTPPGAPQPDGLDPKMSVDEFWQKTLRFREISSTVWEAYAAGDSSGKAILKEYDTLYRQIAARPLMPYYETVAADFFAWLKKAISN